VIGESLVVEMKEAFLHNEAWLDRRLHLNTLTTCYIDLKTCWCSGICAVEGGFVAKVMPSTE
jgi:hypothetical protein